MVLAMIVALAADGLQLSLASVGWFGLDQAIDAVAMLVLSRVIGFHILLLPTFVIELVPVLDDLPTWTACTAAVIALRKREQRQSPPAPPPPAGPANAEKPVIDI
jgi:hypothetical protein